MTKNASITGAILAKPALPALVVSLLIIIIPFFL